MNLVPVKPRDLDGWLPQIGWHLDSFAASGVHSAADFVADCRAGRRQMWIAADDRVRAVLLTLVNADRKNSVSMTHCAGDGVGDWIGLFGMIEEWARDIGATRLEVIARPGWERVLRDTGLTKAHVMLEKGL